MTSTLDAEATVRCMWARGIAPDAQITVSEWADRYRVLSQRASAEPGRYRTDRTPYMREIMDALSPSSPIERVVLQAGAQLSKTEAGLNWLGFIIDQAPGPVMMVQPTVEMSKRTSKQRVDAMIAATPRLREKIRPARERDSNNTILMKDFSGGTLVMTGANSAVGLRSMPVRYLFLDEIDGYPADAGGEGSPIGLAEARTSTYAHRRKVFLCSTPTVDGSSAIQAAYEDSDKRIFETPCPSCGDRHELAWKDITWTALERRPEDAAWCCPSCGGIAEHSAKPWMLSNGTWRATADGPPGVAGYRLSGLVSPWVSWGKIASEFVQAKGHAERMKVWTNTRLGECFADISDAPDWRRLADRAEDYQPGTVPRGGVILTAGADVQKDRIEVEVVSWGRGHESWSVDYRVLFGDPSQPDVWRQMDDLLGERFPTADGGSLEIARLCIDSGGHHTSEVLAWAMTHPAERVMAIKGRDNLSAAIGAPVQTDINLRTGRKARGGRVWPVGVSLLKSRLYSWLASEPPRGDESTPHGFCHFPAAHGDEYFKQLTAERKVRRKTRSGYQKFEWEKIRERNEALDCRVYAMAAMETLRLDRWTDADWEAAEAGSTGAAVASPATSHRAKGQPRVRKSSWLA